MLNEFYNYIANNALSFFQKKADDIRPGERYCLKLDNEDMVSGVDEALRKQTEKNGMQGNYTYKDVYKTFTIHLTENMEIVVASKINGMTADFLATLRNAELTDKHYPILMITDSLLDTITSGTGDLSASGMPFHAASIIEKIKNDIKNSNLPVADRILLEEELAHKQHDRFSDKSSLYEYADLLNVLGRGYVNDTDYPHFALIPDPELRNMLDEKKIKARLKENFSLFKVVDQAYKHGNIEEDLGSIFENAFVTHVSKCKKKDASWYQEYTYEQVLASKEKHKKKLDNPLEIKNTDISAYSDMPLEYQFISDDNLFIRDDGLTKAQQRKKNILIFNPDGKNEVTVSIHTNISIRSTWISASGCLTRIESKELLITFETHDIKYARVDIKDPNANVPFQIKICVIDIPARLLENVQTSFTLFVNKKATKGWIDLYGVTKELVINPGNENVISAKIVNDGQFVCDYNQTLRLLMDQEIVDNDIGYVSCSIRSGSITVPIRIKDEVVKPTEMTGISAFQWKYANKKSIEYRGENKLVTGTKEYNVREPFASSLKYESLLVQNGWLGIVKTMDSEQENLSISVPVEVRAAYVELTDAFKTARTLPSLAFYKKDSPLFIAAKRYVDVVGITLSNISSGETLSNELSDMAFIGCVVENYDERTIMMSPLHPLNVLYQLQLLDESSVGTVKSSLIEKLTPLYLLPFVKDSQKTLYRAVEQKHSPEWRFYAPVYEKRYQGARNFVQRLVSNKIEEYKDHFSFLFDDIGNNHMIINLINMGDCSEIFRGLVRFYLKSLKDSRDPDDLLHFDINIYATGCGYNEFSILSDLHKLKEYLRNHYTEKELEDPSEMALILTGKIRYFLKNPNKTEYKYAHLAFYEMPSSENTGASHMDSITTGLSLNGLVSGTPSVLNMDWYKTGFGTKYAPKNQLVRLAAYYNALCRVAYSGSSYEPESCIFTEIEKGNEDQLRKIYQSSNWVVFVDPKVDLSFFQKKSPNDEELMIIHYSDQYTSASGYDDITVTQKSEQYNAIITEQLQKKGVSATAKDINGIISLFNAVNGGWLLRLITAKKLTGAADSYFSREKMSILSAIKLCMAYYSHPDIVWVPISLEEMLRVSRGVGLSQKDGLLSARNLGFDQRVACDDILLVGIEGTNDHLMVYLHPVEVKIGLNPAAVISKAQEQVINTYNGFWESLWPEDGRNDLETKLSRNFFMQLVVVCCEKMKLYDIYPEENWDDVISTYRENLLNEHYKFSDAMDQYIGKGTIVSFGADTLIKSGKIDDQGICLLEMPENLGSSYMVKSAKEIEDELNTDRGFMPECLKETYKAGSKEGETIQVITPVEKEEKEPPYVYDTSVLPSFSANQMEAQSKSRYVTDMHVQDSSVEHQSEVAHDKSDQVEEPRNGMQVLFGKDVSTGNPLLWCPNDTDQIFHSNTGIIGTMGTGKTQFTKSMIAQLYQNRKNNIGSDQIGILIFDYKGDYNESKEDFIQATNAKVFKPYRLPFNPLALIKSKVFKPLLPVHTANAFKDTLSKVYGLGPKQQNTLFQCIIEAYSRNGIAEDDPDTWDQVPPTFDQVYSIYENNEDIKKTDSLAATMDKLHTFRVFESDPSKTKSLYDLLDGVVVIDLSTYDADIQSLIVAITLDLFYSQMQAAGSSKLLNGQYRQLTKMILVDEADNFMSEGFPALKKILKEGREFGVGTILSTQFLKHFGIGEDDYSKYILTWVVHNVADLKASDVEFVFQMDAKSQESQKLYSDIKALQKHHSIVKIGNSKPKYIEDKAFWELYKEMQADASKD